MQWNAAECTNPLCECSNAQVTSACPVSDDTLHKAFELEEEFPKQTAWQFGSSSASNVCNSQTACPVSDGRTHKTFKLEEESPKENAWQFSSSSASEVCTSSPNSEEWYFMSPDMAVSAMNSDIGIRTLVASQSYTDTPMTAVALVFQTQTHKFPSRHMKISQNLTRCMPSRHVRTTKSRGARKLSRMINRSQVFSLHRMMSQFALQDDVQCTQGRMIATFRTSDEE